MDLTECLHCARFALFNSLQNKKCLTNKVTSLSSATGNQCCMKGVTKARTAYSMWHTTAEAYKLFITLILNDYNPERIVIEQQ